MQRCRMMSCGRPSPRWGAMPCRLGGAVVEGWLCSQCHCLHHGIAGLCDSMASEPLLIHTSLHRCRAGAHHRQGGAQAADHAPAADSGAAAGGARRGCGGDAARPQAEPHAALAGRAERHDRVVPVLEGGQRRGLPRAEQAVVVMLLRLWQVQPVFMPSALFAMLPLAHACCHPLLPCWRSATFVACYNSNQFH